MQNFESDIHFTCPECGQISSISVSVPELDFSGEGFADHQSEGNIYFECPACDKGFEGYATCNGHGCNIALSDLGLEFDGGPPMYSPEEDDWLGYEVPDNPYGIFEATYTGMRTFVGVVPDNGGDTQLFSRMIFSQLIAALEAYLADTLINAVLADKDKLNSLLTKDDELGKEKFTLVQISQDEEFVKNNVRAFLKRIVYHNLGRVNSLYTKALKISLDENAVDWQELHKAIANRHDCVHRNGFTSEGAKNDAFTIEYVMAVFDLVHRFVNTIQGKLDNT